VILIDSTLYIDWLRRRVDLRQILEPWILAQAVAGCGIVRAEVVRGILDPRQKQRLQEIFDVVLEVPTDPQLWHTASELAWGLDRKGIVLPLTDIVIAACALRVHATIVTTDPHFSRIPDLAVRSDVPLLE
jgi:hypothetical protein